MRQSQVRQLQNESKLIEMVRQSQGDLLGVAPFLATLEKAHTEAMSSRSQRESLAAATREATRRLGKDLAAAGDAAIALRSFIKSVLGFRSPRLGLYGIKVRKRGRRTRPPVSGRPG